MLCRQNEIIAAAENEVKLNLYVKIKLLQLLAQVYTAFYNDFISKLNIVFREQITTMYYSVLTFLYYLFIFLDFIYAYTYYIINKIVLT